MRRQARRDVLCEIQSVLDALRRNARFATVSQSTVISEVSLIPFFAVGAFLLRTERDDGDYLCAWHLTPLQGRTRAQATYSLERMTRA